MDIRNFDILFLNIHFSRFETKFNGGARYNIKRAREKISFRGGGTPLEYSETWNPDRDNECKQMSRANVGCVKSGFHDGEKGTHEGEKTLSLSLPLGGIKGVSLVC